MELKDLFLGPLYLLVCYFILLNLRRKLTNKDNKKYFFLGFNLKVVGCIAFAIIYQFYYDGGDTYNFYKQSTVVYNTFLNDPATGIDLLFYNGNDQQISFKYSSTLYWLNSPTEFFVVKIAFVLGLLTFNSYLAISFFFTLFSFLGLWYLYLTLCSLYPILYKKLAIAVFYVPSLFFWGSGLMKDTLCLASLGFLIYGAYHLFILKKKIAKSFFFLIISLFILINVKLYIILCLAPFLSYWIIIANNNRIKSKAARNLLKPVFIFIGGTCSYFVVTGLMEENTKYDTANIARQTQINAEYIYSVSVKNEGSGYFLGEMDGTISNMVSLSPQAIIVSLFRPFMWEVKNPIMLLSALESTFVLVFTISFLVKLRLRFFIWIFSDTFLIVCFGFSVLFGIVVGLNSFNFGTLARYKIPLIPFYFTLIFVMQERLQKNKRTTSQIAFK